MSSGSRGGGGGGGDQTSGGSPMLTRNMEMESDRLSNLPKHLIEHILCYLPITDAVRSSILSRKWRYQWATIPTLVLDNVFFQPFSWFQQAPNYVARMEELSNVVSSILLLHTGSLSKFKLSLGDVLDAGKVDRWMSHLSRRHVKVFILEMWNHPRYRIPSSVYTYQDLTSLELVNCKVILPPSFKGFRALTSLLLEEVKTTQDSFENLISCCPLLESLRLILLDGIDILKIHAPNLLRLWIKSVFERVTLESTLKLSTVHVELSMNGQTDLNAAQGSTGNFVTFFGHLSSIKELYMSGIFFKYLTSGDVPQNLSTMLLHLHRLSIALEIDNPKEILAALCLLRSAPNLQKLEIVVRKEDSGAETASSLSTDPELMAKYQHLLFREKYQHLQFREISGITDAGPGVDFINFLLVNFPYLEVLTTKPA